MISTTYVFSSLSRPGFAYGNSSIKLVQVSVSSKRELINSCFHEQFIDVSEIPVKVEINLL